MASRQNDAERLSRLAVRSALCVVRDDSAELRGVYLRVGAVLASAASEFQGGTLGFCIVCQFVGSEAHQGGA